MKIRALVKKSLKIVSYLQISAYTVHVSMPTSDNRRLQLLNPLERKDI
jgi:hypothetical protein